MYITLLETEGGISEEMKEYAGKIGAGGILYVTEEAQVTVTNLLDGTQQKVSM